MMDNSSATPVSPEETRGRGAGVRGEKQELHSQGISSEIQDFIDSVNQGKGFNAVTEIISEEVQRQLESHLLNFQSCIAQSNLAAIEVMAEELQKIKEESATLSGVMERLTAAVAPDLPATEDEVVSFQQAINNLEQYGAIIPSKADIVASQFRLKNQRAWSLVWQALAKLLIKKVEKVFAGKPKQSDPLEEKFKQLEDDF
ncbi:MAG: hypothetical protein KME59_18730 [Trichormus sp. ATA11-4-KO1]|nr:hypothetical protein [Trichormus sp. ATA11-4-KO1]